MDNVRKGVKDKVRAEGHAVYEKGGQGPDKPLKNNSRKVEYQVEYRAKGHMARQMAAKKGKAREKHTEEYIAKQPFPNIVPSVASHCGSQHDCRKCTYQSSRDKQYAQLDYEMGRKYAGTFYGQRMVKADAL